MSVEYVSYEQARNMVLNRLRTWVQSLPPARRQLKLVKLGYAISPLEMIREVEMNTSLGQQLVAAELNAISQVERVTYIVQG